MTLSSKSDSGTFDLFRYDIVDMDDIGLTHKLFVTMYINGPLANVDFSVGDLGSTNLYGTYTSKHMTPPFLEYNIVFITSVEYA
jgi:hypothetical protein